MTETREFPSLLVATLSTGIGLWPCNYSDLQKVVSFVLGWDVFTHHLADRKLLAECRKLIAGQCPGMPGEMPDKELPNGEVKRVAADVVARFGQTVTLRKGDGKGVMGPLDGIPEHLQGENMIVAIAPELN